MHNWNEVEDLGIDSSPNIHQLPYTPMYGWISWIGGLQSLQENVVENLYFHLESHMEASDVEAFCRI